RRSCLCGWTTSVVNRPDAAGLFSDGDHGTAPGHGDDAVAWVVGAKLASGNILEMSKVRTMHLPRFSERVSSPMKPHPRSTDGPKREHDGRMYPPPFVPHSRIISVWHRDTVAVVGKLCLAVSGHRMA